MHGRITCAAIANMEFGPGGRGSRAALMRPETSAPS